MTTIQDITGQLQDCLEDYEKTSLDCNPVFAKTQPQVLELINCYLWDKYRDAGYDELGFLKPFYNVVETPALVASKMIDVDVRDINIIAAEGEKQIIADFFEKDFKLWLKEKRFGQFLNELVFNWPRYGDMVLKKAGEDIYRVFLENFIAEPGAEDIQNARYVIEKHDYSPYQLRQKEWDNIEKAIKDCQKDGHIWVYELWIEDKYYILAVKPSKVVRDLKAGVLLHSSDAVQERPYKHLPWEKIPGRLLGRGVVEKLFHSQIYQNKIAYYKARGAHWTSKHLYQTRDEEFEKNLTTDVEEGRVLTVRSEISPVPVEERNLHFYREEEERWDLLVDKRTFSWDITRGQRPPAGLTLGQSILQTKMAAGYYDYQRERLGLFLKEVFYDWILPVFEKTANKRHKLYLRNGLFSEDEISRYTKTILEYRLRERVVDWIAKNKRYPSASEIEMLREIIKHKKEKDIIIPPGFYKGLKYKIDFEITGESIDISAKVSTLQTILVMISQNPTILQDSSTRKIFFQLLDLLGIPSYQFQQEEPELPETIIPQRGGSLPRLPAITTPQEVEVPRKV